MNLIPKLNACRPLVFIGGWAVSPLICAVVNSGASRSRRRRAEYVRAQGVTGYLALAKFFESNAAVCWSFAALKPDAYGAGRN
jgi:hypothetical protein